MTKIINAITFYGSISLALYMSDPSTPQEAMGGATMLLIILLGTLGYRATHN